MMDIGTIFSLPVINSGVINGTLPSTGSRLAFLLIALGVIFLFEVGFPLFSHARGHLVRHSLRNLLLTAIFLGVNYLLSPISPFATDIVTETKFGLSGWLGLPPAGQLLVGIVGLDLFAYLAHVTMHKLSWLWRFHRVHHSDNAVDVTTAFREHPGETLWRVGWHIAGVIAFGTPMWVLISYLTLSALNAQFEHANIRLPAGLDRWLRRLFVTPNMHKVHHSRDLPETDMNYSNLLSIWDRIGRTYSHGPRLADIRYGLDGFDDREKQSVGGLLKMSFMKSWGNGDTASREQSIDRRAA